ncbi:arsenate reductase ArsC [Nitrosospira sp. NpAV]|uniref:arsenate reductase ArsC n=1 Tax=Nitrosospira sp. NpAV TaxID=58133 RepID=UPI0005A24234|nr:arsenate reductase ArsC [Nitrosospira sp. NpAV]KIO49026.1 arsenate reductase [Nitrosospira sp. NpAV]
MTIRPFNVLFLCTGNSARSILAETYLNASGQGRFHAYSAGSFPTGKVNPYALELLEENHLPTEGLRSKAWDEFAKPDAPKIDIIITVCDQAAGEVCPVWPGQPITAHWGVEDPAKATGDNDAKQTAFIHAFSVLQRRIDLLINLNPDRLDRRATEEQLRTIGEAE